MQNLRMLIVKDNFLKDPYKIRNIALKEEYNGLREETDSSRYPGYRSFSVPEVTTNYILSQIQYLVEDTALKHTGSAFQYVTKDFKRGIFHRDPGSYTSIIFLSLEPPENSGTEIADTSVIPYSEEEWNKMNDIKSIFYRNTGSWIKRYRYEKIVDEISNHFNPIKIPNKFNRFILFDAPHLHNTLNALDERINILTDDKR